MGKLGGPCQGPGTVPGTVCGVTIITDSSSWRNGGKFKPEHKGKACCTKRTCRIYLGVIKDPSAAVPPAVATAPAPEAVAAAPIPLMLAPILELQPPQPLQPQPPPPLPPLLGDASLHFCLPYGLISPPIPPAIAPTAAVTRVATPPATSSATLLKADAESDGWREEDDEEEDLFSELAQLLTSTERPKFSVVLDSFERTRMHYEEECDARDRKVRRLQIMIKVLQTALALTVTPQQDQVCKRVSASMMSAPSGKEFVREEFEAKLKAELERDMCANK